MLAGKWLKVNVRVSVEGKCVGKMGTNPKLPPPKIAESQQKLQEKWDGYFNIDR